MTSCFPTLIFWITFSMFSGDLICAFLGKNSLADKFRIAGICSCLTGLVWLVFLTQRPPLFGPFEASMYMVLILALLAGTYPGKRGKKSSDKAVFRVSPFVILMVMGLAAKSPLAINDDYYMYDHVWVILFFNLRLVAAAFFVHVMVLHLVYFFERGEGGTGLLRTARYQTLGGAVVYLCSEWSGSLWCLNWFGDSWQWSNGFLKASLLFLLVMLIFHLPAMLGKNTWVRVILGSLPGTFALWMIFYH